MPYYEIKHKIVGTFSFRQEHGTDVRVAISALDSCGKVSSEPLLAICKARVTLTSALLAVLAYPEARRRLG